MEKDKEVLLLFTNILFPEPEEESLPNEAVFEYDGSTELKVTAEMIKSYQKNGYVYMR